MADQLMIQNGDHLCHFGQSLTETYSSQVWSDVVLHVGDGSGRQLKTHRVVLASISDFLSSLLTRHSSFGAEEEVVHLTLAEMDFESVKIILGFAYDGEAKIPRTSVEAVCEVANELRVKYLKDSFVKVNQKEYQEIRAGRKSLKSIGGSSPQPLQGVMGSPGGARSSSPSKRVAGKPTPSGGVKSPSSKKVKKEKLSESDTDSADSDDETHRIAAESQASGAADVVASEEVVISSDSPPSRKTATPQKKPLPKSSSAKPSPILFTITQQSEDGTTKTISEDGAYMVHFKPPPPPPRIKDQENRIPTHRKVPASAPTRPAARSAPAVQRQILVGPSTSSSSSSSSPAAAGRRMAVPNLATVPRVKKVMIPPMARPGRKSLTTGQPIMLDPNSFQVQTILQPDGTQIQVLKQQSSQIMKQINSVKGSSPPIRVVSLASPSAVTGQDPLARVVRETIVGGPKSPPPIRLKQQQVQLVVSGSSPATSPRSPPRLIPLKTASSPTKTVPAAAATKKKGTAATTALKTAPVAAVLTTEVSSEHSVSSPKPIISPTVPDDFLMPENAGAGGKGEESSSQTSSTAGDKTPSKTAAASMASESSLTRSSGRARKANPKYKDNARDQDLTAAIRTSTASKASKNTSAAESPSSHATANNRKRKFTEPTSSATEEETEEEEEEKEKKEKVEPPTKKEKVSNKSSNSSSSSTSSSSTSKASTAATSPPTKRNSSRLAAATTGAQPQKEPASKSAPPPPSTPTSTSTKKETRSSAVATRSTPRSSSAAASSSSGNNKKPTASSSAYEKEVLTPVVDNSPMLAGKRVRKKRVFD